MNPYGIWDMFTSHSSVLTLNQTWIHFRSDLLLHILLDLTDLRAACHNKASLETRKNMNSCHSTAESSVCWEEQVWDQLRDLDLRAAASTRVQTRDVGVYTREHLKKTGNTHTHWNLQMYEATSSPVDVHMNLVKDLSRHISSFLTLYLAVWHFEVSRGLHVNERRSSIMWPLLGRAVIYSCWGEKKQKKKTAWLNVTAYITAGDVSFSWEACSRPPCLHRLAF